MNRVGIFIDGANIRKNMRGRRIHFNQLKEWLANGREVGKACYFNCAQKANEPEQAFFGHVAKSGFCLFIREAAKTKATGELKFSGDDVYLAVKVMKYLDCYDTLVLVSGDYDFSPLLWEMKQAGKEVEVVSWKDSLHPFYRDRVSVRYLDEFMKLLPQQEVPSG